MIKCWCWGFELKTSKSKSNYFFLLIERKETGNKLEIPKLTAYQMKCGNFHAFKLHINWEIYCYWKYNGENIKYLFSPTPWNSKDKKCSYPQKI